MLFRSHCDQEIFATPCIGEGDGNPPQCSCLENPRDGGAWWAAVYGVAQSRARQRRLSSRSGIEDVLTESLRKVQEKRFVLHTPQEGRPIKETSFYENFRNHLCGLLSTLGPCHILNVLIVVQLLSSVWLFATPWAVARQAPLSSTISWSLFKFIPIELVMPSN